MRTNMSWSSDDIEVQDHYIETENYEALAIFHADCAGRYGIDTVLQDIVDAWNFRLKEHDTTAEFTYE